MSRTTPDLKPNPSLSRDQCPLCEKKTVSLSSRILLYLGSGQRCPDCMAGWKFTWSKWLYHLPIALVFLVEVAMVHLLGFGLHPVLVVFAVILTVGLVPNLLPLELRMADPFTVRAIRRVERSREAESAE